jgi:methionyl-tRNA formyltransferase
MKILFLGYSSSPLVDWLEAHGEEVIATPDKLTVDDVKAIDAEFLISYGYRHILKKDILDLFPRKAINLHISLLPYNRGAYPNIWSFIEDTPKGVTIHYLDEGIDTGDIIVQQWVNFNEDDETMATSYEKLNHILQELFKRHWDGIKTGSIEPLKQNLDLGSYHTTKDIVPEPYLMHHWDEKISDIKKKCVQVRK